MKVSIRRTGTRQDLGPLIRRQNTARLPCDSCDRCVWCDPNHKETSDKSSVRSLIERVGLKSSNVSRSWAFRKARSDTVEPQQHNVACDPRPDRERQRSSPGRLATPERSLQIRRCISSLPACPVIAVYSRAGDTPLFGGYTDGSTC